MSQTAGVTCLTCREHGPLVGDFGLLGLPAIEPVRICAVSGGHDDVPSFGFLYEGLTAVGLQRFDLDECAAWLRIHAGHRFAIDIEGSNDEIAELEEDEAVGDAAQELWDGAPVRLQEALARGDYLLARHHVTCAACNEHLTSSAPEPFRVFGAHRLDHTSAECFLERWKDVDDTWTYRLYGAVDPFEDHMKALVPFIAAHATHGIEVQLATA